MVLVFFSESPSLSLDFLVLSTCGIIKNVVRKPYGLCLISGDLVSYATNRAMVLNVLRFKFHGILYLLNRYKVN